MSIALFGPMTLRQLGSKWWTLNKREKGFASSGRCFASLEEALGAFDAKVIDSGTDEHGFYLTAVSR